MNAAVFRQVWSHLPAPTLTHPSFEPSLLLGVSGTIELNEKHTETLTLARHHDRL